MTMGLVVGNRGFFPDHLAKSGREEMLGVLQAAGIEVVALTPNQSKHGAVRNPGRIAGVAPAEELFQRASIARTFQTESLCRAARLRPERTRDRRYFAAGGSACSRVNPGHAGRSQENDHCLSPRQFLRQDVGLQQSAPVRHSLFHHHALHQSRTTRRSLPTTCWNGFRRYAGW